MNQECACEVCKRPVNKDEEGDPFCSQFCLEGKMYPSQGMVAGFLALKAGDFGLWPCSICGCTVEDEYVPGGNCAQCAPKRKILDLEARNANLAAALKLMVDFMSHHVESFSRPAFLEARDVTAQVEKLLAHE